MEAVRRNLLPNPREKANCISVVLFWWTLDMFKTGIKKVLALEDLYRPLNEDKSENLGDRLDVCWKKQTKKSDNPSLIKAIVQTFWREYTYLGALIVTNELVIRLTQPYLLGRLLLFFRKDSTMSHEEALYYAGGIVLSNLTNALFTNQFYVDSFHYGMKVRVAVCSIIYRKALRLSQTALGETAFGKVVNLLSNDVNRFDLVTLFIHYMWVAPLMCIVIAYLLWLEVRWAGIIGLGIIFIVVPLQSWTGKLSSRFRLQTALRTDERVRFMDEIISGVQVIKFYAWELPFSRLIASARKMELKIVRKNAYVRALYMTFLLFTTRTGVFCTMLSIVMLYGTDQLTASKVFVISAYFSIVSLTMSQLFVRGVAEIAEALVAMKRLRNFLLLEEKTERSLTYVDDLKPNGADSHDMNEKFLEIENNLLPEIAVSMKNVSARWIVPDTPHSQNKSVNSTAEKNCDIVMNGKTIVDPSDDEHYKAPTLQNINLDLRKGLLIGVVGPVGAGKSSFLQAILRELPLDKGRISVCGSVSYASQVPWVFAASVRQNILFGQEMDRYRFDAVVKSCDLIKDFEQLEHGERTIIGERGASLSGGQKARINLARAVYHEADVYLLDDPLSAVDAHVGRHLFNKCIGPMGRLGRLGATRILVTHQVHFLKDADYIIVLRDGKIEACGSPNELSTSGIDIATLLESNADSPEKCASGGRRSRSQSVRSLSSSINENEEEESDMDREKSKSMDELQQLEKSSKGQIKGSVGLTYLKSGTNVCLVFILFIFFLLTQALASGADYWVSFWTSQEELREYYSRLNESIVAENGMDNGSNSTTDRNEIMNFLQTKIPFFDGYGLVSTDMCIYIHALLISLVFIISLMRSVGFYSSCIRASQNLHDNMFKGIISTTMRFFDTNPSGRILNRFSKDMGSVDEILPKAILDASQIILNMVGAIIVTAIVNPLFLVPVTVLGVIFIYTRKIYLKTSKNIKRLEGICRSPVFTHIAASLNGLATIRAFGAQRILIEEFDNHQDLHSACWYMFITTNTAFGLVLDFMCVIFVCVITFFFLLADQSVLGGQVGLAITQVMGLTGMLQWGIRQSAEVANQLMSVERILEYRDLTPEKIPKKPQQLAKSWPEEGTIEFRNVIYRYFDEAEPVLRGLNFIVRSREKIGIVGRTGAGKSSLIGAIFRMAVIDGEIIIDGIDTSTILLNELRSRVSIIPQDPVLFSGTLRRNLDPFEEYPDNEIWRALEEVELKDVASSHLGLQSSVMAGGSNFSVGQRQLMCLARAILRNNRILVLDEATANVDPHTDSLIQKTIRQKFAKCTVLTVAHRLHTIMDSDRVLVMDSGKAIEFASPHELLQMEKGILSEMVQTLGTQEAERLAKIAEQKYKQPRIS